MSLRFILYLTKSYSNGLIPFTNKDGAIEQRPIVIILEILIEYFSANSNISVILNNLEFLVNPLKCQFCTSENRNPAFLRYFDMVERLKEYE